MERALDSVCFTRFLLTKLKFIYVKEYVPTGKFRSATAVSVQKPYEWYLDYECLFLTISKMVHCLNCVLPKSERIQANGIIFFQTIDLLLLPYFEWLNTLYGFYVIDLNEDEDEYMARAWFNKTLSPKNNIKVLTLYCSTDSFVSFPFFVAK